MDVAYYVVLVKYARGDEGYEEGNINASYATNLCIKSNTRFNKQLKFECTFSYDTNCISKV